MMHELYQQIRQHLIDQVPIPEGRCTFRSYMTDDGSGCYISVLNNGHLLECQITITIGGELIAWSKSGRLQSTLSNPDLLQQLVELVRKTLDRATHHQPKSGALL